MHTLSTDNGNNDDFASAAIRAGLVLLSQQKAEQGATIFLVPPGWVPADGHAKLVKVVVTRVEDGVAVCEDDGKQIWAIWR